MGGARRGQSRSRVSGWALAVAMASGGCLATAGARADTPVSAAEAIHYLNYQRADNGLPGGVVENPAWDAGCADHLSWMEANPSVANPHQEIPGTPGFTAAGAAAGETSVLAVGADWAASTDPWGATDPWESAPIHLMQLLSPDLLSTGWADDGSDVCMVTWAGYDRPGPPVAQLLTYPGAGTEFAATSELASEWPFTPGEFVGLPAGTATGPYLFVFGDGTGRGAITRASLSGPNGPVAVKTVDDDTIGPLGDLGSYLPAGGMIIPVAPLVTGATYRASVTFAPDEFDWNDDLAGGAGPPLSLSWSFQVAGGPPTLNGIFRQGELAASSNVPGIVDVAVTRLPSGTAVASYEIDPSGRYRLFNLPGARYKACFAETKTPAAAPPGECVDAAWRTAPAITVGPPVRGAGWLRVPLTASPAVAGVGASLTLAAPAGRCPPASGPTSGSACAASRSVFYRRTVTLAAHQTVRLPDRGREVLTLTTPQTSRGDYLFSARTVTVTLDG